MRKYFSNIITSHKKITSFMEENSKWKLKNQDIRISLFLLIK